MSFGELDIIGTIKAFSMNDLLKVRRVVNAAIRAKRPSRPKQGKSKSDLQRAWDEMLENATECEACGWRKGDASPWWWRADNCLDRAHIIGGTGKRYEDPKLCVILCRACHHQQTIGRRVVGCTREPLTLAHLHWIKTKHADYDPAFIRKRNANRPLVTPQELPGGYLG